MMNHWAIVCRPESFGRSAGSVLCASGGGVSRLVATAGQPGYDREGVVVAVGTKSVYAVD
jgi:hypothetical protein